MISQELPKHLSPDDIELEVVSRYAVLPLTAGAARISWSLLNFRLLALQSFRDTKHSSRAPDLLRTRTCQAPYRTPSSSSGTKIVPTTLLVQVTTPLSLHVVNLSYVSCAIVSVVGPQDIA